MRFEWNPLKNQANQEKHGLAFEDIFSFDWAVAVVVERTRVVDGEARFAAISTMNGKVYTVVYTVRKSVYRIISFRRANKQEEQAYAKTTNQ